MAITTTEQTSIIKLVLGMFNAAPGATNLSSIVAHYEANGKDLSNLADALASNAAFTNQFAGLVTVSGIANKMAANFGLTTGTAYTNAVAYFTQEITAGKSNQSIMKAAVDYLNGSTVDAVYADVVTTLTNKYTVALDYSVTKQLSAATVAELQAVVASVDATAASVTAAIAASATGTAYTLTTSADVLTGTTGDDTFTAGVSATTADNTLGLIDTIDGGAGTDILNVTAAVLAANIAVPAANISNVETISIKAVDADGTVGADAATFAVGTISGITNVIASGNSNVTVTGLATGSAVTMSGNGNTVNGILSYAYATATAAQTINVTGGTLNTGVASITATASTGVTTATINSTGATNKVDVIKLDSNTGNTVTSLTVNATTGLTATLTATDYANTAALTVTGAGAVNLGTAGVFKTIDASAATGGLTIDVDTVATSVKGSTGNDVFTTSATTATTAGLVDGGAGTDTLALNNVTDTDTASEAAEYINFETLRANGTVDASLIAGITAIELTAATNAITKMSATQAANVTAYGTTIGDTTLALTTATGTTDALTVKLGTGITTAAAAATSILTVTGFETLNLATNHGATATVGANQTSTITGAIVGATLTAVNLTGSAFTFTDIATTKAVTIDGSALTGNGNAATAIQGLTVAGSAKAASTIKGSDFTDSLTIGAVGSTYQGNAGNDTIIAAQAAAAGSVSIDGGTGTDTIKINDLSATTATLTVDDNTLKAVTNVEVLNFSGAVAGDFLWTLGGYANTMATANSGVIKVTAADFATKVTGDIITIDASGLSGTNAIDLTLTNTIDNGAAYTGTNLYTGSAGNDTFKLTYDTDHANAQAVITVNAGNGNDTITLIEGTTAVGTRNLNGEAGNDTITGSAGADIITGGTGQDTMTGGADADIFHVASGSSGITLATADTITDFTTTSDDLDVGTAGTYTEFLGTAQTEATFLVAAAAAFDGTGTDAYVSVNAAASGNAWVLVDMDADGTVSANDTFIVLTGIDTLAEIITGDII